MAKRETTPAKDGPSSASLEADKHLADMEGANVRSVRGLNALLKDVAKAEGVTIQQLLYDMLRNPLKARFMANYETIIRQRRNRLGMESRETPPPDQE